jgi:ferredoxin
MERMAEIKIEIFEERCIGAGNCTDVAPEYFGLKDSDGTVELHREDVDSGDAELVQRAVDFCPVAAIQMRSDATQSVIAQP